MLKQKRIKTSTAVHSDVGKVRKANEDSYYISKNENLIIVCDGMGGQVAGGLASKIAVETIKDIYQELSEEGIQEFLYESEKQLASSSRRLIVAVRLANRRIYNVSKRFPKLRGMGTTVVALTLDKSFATMVHVGDSRIFRHSDNKVLQLTQDHSWLNELIEDNEINAEQIETFAQKNVITRALGTGPAIKIDIHCEKYKKNDIYVLCTDGLHTSVGAKDIKKTVARSNGSIDTATRGLLTKALHRDGSDNITVAVARVDQDSRETKRPALSTVIPEEGDRLLAKADKFIQEHYTEPNLQNSRIPMTNAFSTRPFMLPILVLATGLICFMLGMLIKGGRSSARTNIQAQQMASAAGIQRTGIQGGQSELIQRSDVQEDAVLAFVFFNSESDFNKAKLEQRGLLIDKIHPYAENEQLAITGDFSIFLIDAANNVINKTSGIQIPNPER